MLNLALDVVLVFGFGPVPALGVPGAAIATVVCTWVQLGITLLGLGAAPAGTRRRADMSQLARAARLGMPVGLHFIAESAVFSLTGVLASRLGTLESAAHQVALQWGSLTFCVASGIGSAAATRVGWGVGAKDLGFARRAGLTAFGSVCVFMLAASLTFIVVRHGMARVMSSDEGVISLVVAGARRRPLSGL